MLALLPIQMAAQIYLYMSMQDATSVQNTICKEETSDLLPLSKATQCNNTSRTNQQVMHNLKN